MLSIYRIWDREPGSKIGAFLGPFLDCLKRINVLSAKKKVVNIDIFYVFPVVVRPLLYCVSLRCELTPERSQGLPRLCSSSITLATHKHSSTQAEH